ncbi:ran-binding proteins 9/10 homolog [Drosophila bipectinata]|uniref:ran-binding proteins 9/10 homolog n=1 Tax=Drosophila bipectinata TaxID=42026 RepID=UPI0038B38310
MENIEGSDNNFEPPQLSSESNSNNSSASSSSHQLSQSGAAGAPSPSHSPHSHSHSPTPSPSPPALSPAPVPDPFNAPSDLEGRDQQQSSSHDHSPTPTFHQTAPPPTTPSTAPQQQQQQEHEQQLEQLPFPQDQRDQPEPVQDREPDLQLEEQQQQQPHPEGEQQPQPEDEPEAEPPPPLLLEEEAEDPDSESQEHREVIDANAIADTIDANAVERIDDYEDEEGEAEEEGGVRAGEGDGEEQPLAPGVHRLHSVAVLPRYSTTPLPQQLRASRHHNNNNNNNINNNNSSGSSSSSRRTRHFYSNNGSHFSNDMFPSHSSRSNAQGSPRVGSRRQHSAPAAASNSPQHPGVDPLRVLYPNVNENETPLPRCWSPHDKCLSIGLSQNNLRVTYKGVGKQHSDAASVRTAYPIPSSCGLYYFEVRIISRGRNGYMGIGLTAQQFRMNRLPGWDKQSYGYHGDDGNSFSSSGNGQTYGPTFTTGDVIGCCVNFVNNTCFYTKNGVDLGIAFRDLPTKLYPTVGLQTPGEEVDANFGQEPFKFDKIVDMMKEMRSNVLRKIDRYPHLLETPENLMNRLVSTYLVHNGYSKTAEAFNGYTNQSFDEDLKSIKTRQKIIKLILTGKMSQAIEHTLHSYPGLLENNKNLWFALKCRQFIEMVNGADIEQANNKVTATTQTMPTNQTSVIQSTKAFKHSKGNGNANSNQPQQQNNTATPAVIKPQGGDKPDLKNMIVDDNSNKCVEHDSNSMDVEMEPCQSHSNGGGDSCSNGNASAVRNSLDAIDEEMDVDVSPSSRNCGRVIEKILEFGKELSSMGQQLEKENLMTEEERQMLEDAFSLIAYSNPWSSPLGWLLCPSRRENVSSTLNSAILESLSFERRPPLEYLVAHASELIKIIGQHSLGEDAFITIDDVFPQN